MTIIQVIGTLMYILSVFAQCGSFHISNIAQERQSHIKTSSIRPAVKIGASKDSSIRVKRLNSVFRWYDVE